MRMVVPQIVYVVIEEIGIIKKTFKKVVKMLNTFVKNSKTIRFTHSIYYIKLVQKK